MSTDQTTNLGLPFLMPAQAQKHVTVNESLTRLDVLVQAVVESRSVTVQPGSPGDGQAWIAPAGKTGAEWGGYANWALAYYRDGAWEALAPKAGWRVWIKDEGLSAHFSGAVWIDDVAGGSGGDAPAGMRNRLMNGAFDIWQRGASFSEIGYLADRWGWTANGTGGTLTATREVLSPGALDAEAAEPSAYLRVGYTGAPSGQSTNRLYQRIEDVRALVGAATLSFWAHTPDTSHTLTNISVRQNFGSGGSSSVDVQAVADLAIDGTWTRYSYPLTLASLSGKTIGANSHIDVRFHLAENAAKRLDVAAVQFEPGSAATPFERRPLALESALCRRYFERINASTSDPIAVGVATAASSFQAFLQFAPKRVAPTISPSDYTGWRVLASGSHDLTSWGGASSPDEPWNRLRIIGSVAASLTPGWAVLLRPSATDQYIDIDAEL